MKLNYTLGIEDWVEFSLQYLDTSPEGRRVRSSGLIGGILLIFLGGSFAATYFRSVFPLLVGLLALAAWYFFWPWWLRLSQRTATERRHLESKNPCLNGPHQMELTAEGIHATCEVTDTVTRWSGISRIESNPTHGFVFLRNNTGYVIPRGKVEQGDFSEFLAQLQDRLRRQSTTAGED